MGKKAFWAPENKALLIGLIVFVVVILILFGAKIYLYLQYLLGSDTLISLDSSNDFLNLKQGESAEISFKTKVMANLFCSPVCSYSFENIGGNYVADEATTSLKPGISFKKEYQITIPSNGAGVLLYRFSISCHTDSSLLCHTAGLTTTRTALVTAQYGMTDEETQQRESFMTQLNKLAYNFSQIRAMNAESEYALNSLDNYFDVYDLIKEEKSNKNNIEDNKNTFISLNDSWNNQDFSVLSQQISDEEQNVAVMMQKENEMNLTVTSLVDSYNSILDDLMGAKNKIESIKSDLQLVQDASIVSDLNKAISSFNEANSVFEENNLLDDKNQSVADAVYRINKISQSSANEVKNQTLKEEIEGDIISDVLCSSFKICEDHSSINDRKAESTFNLVAACSRIDEFREKIMEINESMEKRAVSQNYSSAGDGFWENVSAMVSNSKQIVVNNFSSQLSSFGKSKSSSNYDLLNGLLIKLPIIVNQIKI